MDTPDYSRWAMSQWRSIDSLKHTRLLLSRSKNFCKGMTRTSDGETYADLADAYSDAIEALDDAVKLHTELRDKYRQLAETEKDAALWEWSAVGCISNVPTPSATARCVGTPLSGTKAIAASHAGSVAGNYSVHSPYTATVDYFCHAAYLLLGC